MTLRTRESVEAAVVWDEVSGNTIFVDYQPGNMTRYLVTITNLGTTGRMLQALGFSKVEPASVLLVCWHGNGCHAFRNHGFLSAGYVAEKLDCGLADAAVLAELIAHYTDREAQSAAEEVAP